MSALTEQQIAEVVEAMRAKRREMVAKPLDRIYGELLAAALPVIERAVLEKAAGWHESQAVQAKVFAGRLPGPALSKEFMRVNELAASHMSYARAIRALGGATWIPEADAPTGVWCRTRRAGEAGENVCRLLVSPDGDREWIERDGGRTTVTHHTFAAPTHVIPLGDHTI